jgi:hypothetical protein
VILLFENSTTRKKYKMRYIKALTERLGPPRTAVSRGGLQENSVYWPNGAGVGFMATKPTLLTPVTHLAVPIIPPDWK